MARLIGGLLGIAIWLTFISLKVIFKTILFIIRYFLRSRSSIRNSNQTEGVDVEVSTRSRRTIDPEDQRIFDEEVQKLMAMNASARFRYAKRNEEVMPWIRMALREADSKIELIDEEAHAKSGKRIYLIVPYAEKDSVKERGGRWDPVVKKWYIPMDLDPSVFAPWFGEAKLRLELVPKGQWYKNLRALVTKSEWDIIRRDVYRRAGNRCEICGGRGSRHPVECHEIWDYSIQSKVQSLVRFIALCPTCHKVKHWGRSTVVGEDMQMLTEHMMRVNGWSQEMVKAYVSYEFTEWTFKNSIEWNIDFSKLPALVNAEKVL